MPPGRLTQSQSPPTRPQGIATMTEWTLICRIEDIPCWARAALPAQGLDVAMLRNDAGGVLACSTAAPHKGGPFVARRCLGTPSPAHHQLDHRPCETARHRPPMRAGPVHREGGERCRVPGRCRAGRVAADLTRPHRAGPARRTPHGGRVRRVGASAQGTLRPPCQQASPHPLRQPTGTIAIKNNSC